jgi:hypothetical protein
MSSIPDAPLKEGRRKLWFQGRNAYVTWVGSSILDPSEFDRRLKAKLPEGTEFSRAAHEMRDGESGLFYYAGLKFPRRVHWTDALKELDLNDGAEIQLERSHVSSVQTER